MTCCRESSYKWCANLPADCTDDEGQKYCVFHAPSSVKGVSVEQFNAKVAALAQCAAGEQVECDLAGTIFPGSVNLDSIVTNTFLRFSHCQFIESVSLLGLVRRPIYFTSAEFLGVANFGGATFEAYTEFNGSCFKKAANFDNTDFAGDVGFRETEFAEGASFEASGLRPEMNIDFASARFCGPANFRNFTPSGSSHVNFSGATFNDRADFSGVDFPGPVTSFGAAEFQSVDFSGSDLRHADMYFLIAKDSNFEGAKLMSADFACASIVGANLRGADLTGADLRFSELRLAKIDRAILTHANLRRADFRGAQGFATWRHADLTGVVLDRTVLRFIPKEFYISAIDSIKLEGLP